MHRSHWHRAFTLIELLVVCSVIALLVAMLLPALSKAREQAMLVKCSVQTRAIAVASAAYAVDFKGNLPPGFGITPGTSTLEQCSKDPGDYWWYRLGGGLQRAGLLWPNYITDSETFYCPTTQGYSTNPTYQFYHHNWGTAGVGTTSGPIAAVVSYAYPATAYDVAKTNYGGTWNGIPGQLWSGTNGMQWYAYWGGSMIEPRIDNNTSSTPISWEVGAGSGAFYTMHDGTATSIAYVDGSAIQFRKVQYLESTLVNVVGVGMNNYAILPALRQFREQGTLP